MIEYFAANYFLSSGYSWRTRAPAAPIGDMMMSSVIWMFGGYGQAFMLVEA